MLGYAVSAHAIASDFVAKFWDRDGEPDFRIPYLPPLPIFDIAAMHYFEFLDRTFEGARQSVAVNGGS
jgi:hypothetical protein